MLAHLQPPKRLVSVIEEYLGDHFERVSVKQLPNGDVVADILGISIGALTAAVLWVEGDPDGHSALREVTYQAACVVPASSIDFPIVVVERFGADLRRHLAYEGRLLMERRPEWNWLIISLERDALGWFQDSEITTLPSPRPQRESAPARHVRR